MGTTGRALEKQKVKHYILVFGLGLLKTSIEFLADVGNAAFRHCHGAVTQQLRLEVQESQIQMQHCH